MNIDVTEQTFQTLVDLALLNDAAEAEVSARVEKNGMVYITMKNGSDTNQLSLVDISYIKNFADFKGGASALYRMKLSSMYEEILNYCNHERKKRNES